MLYDLLEANLNFLNFFLARRSRICFITLTTFGLLVRAGPQWFENGICLFNVVLNRFPGIDHTNLYQSNNQPTTDQRFACFWLRFVSCLKMDALV
jgi:hypothetical protein